MTSTKILLVEDEPSLVLTLEDRLRAEGYAVESVGDGLAGLERAASGEHDLVILDLNLPGKNGLDVCRDLRQRGVSTPVLMLTARSEVVDKVVGLKLGADDYLTKPFDAMELMARIEALLRRSPGLSGALGLPGAPGTGRRVVFGDISVDFEGAEVRKAGQPVELSALEMRLLEYFVAHPGKVLGRDQLLDEVWGYEATPVTRTVDVHVSSLRQKLEDVPSKPRHWLTVHGRGYKFVPRVGE